MFASDSLPLQRSVRRAGPESEPVRRERHAVADVSKAVAVRRTNLQLIVAVLLEREAEVKRGPGRIQPLADGERDAGRVHRAPRELGEALLRLGRRAGGSQHRQDAPAVVPHRPVESRRSEEHTSELQSQSNLVCRLLLEKKKKK